MIIYPFSTSTPSSERYSSYVNLLISWTPACPLIWSVPSHSVSIYTGTFTFVYHSPAPYPLTLPTPHTHVTRHQFISLLCYIIIICLLDCGLLHHYHLWVSIYTEWLNDYMIKWLNDKIIKLLNDKMIKLLNDKMIKWLNEKMKKKN